ncbi:protein FAN-like [Halichondria panicea]|uniref:protein FAN-like n=1 Tax=Halichondria panicea TaxID=6063 RepID=UPI00312BAA9D
MAKNTFCVSDFPHTLIKSQKSAPSSPERFSLLLLEFGEVYFEDFSAVYYPNAETEQEEIERKQRGRLKICSESLVFDPLDFSHPVIKVAFRDCTSVKSWDNNDSRISDNSFTVKTNQFCEMLEGNILSPYKFKKEKCTFVFSLNYGDVSNVLSQVITLVNATKQPKSDHLSLIESLVSSRHAAVSFNTSWLEDLYEEHVLELSGDHVTPMVSNPGRIMLTSSRLYYQPYNNVETEPVLKVALDELRSVLKRRYMLRHTGIELFCRGGYSMFLVLPSPRERNLLYDELIGRRPEAQLSDLVLAGLTRDWQVGRMSNYDYLMMLNHLADRSFNDIMQYPVMPWIIADYTSPSLDLTDSATFRDLSKPVGALTPERLKFFQTRYAEMSGRKFLYGTHYSAPGYVLYYLVRSAPEYLLCLQNGNFDKPNRLFHNIAQTWGNVNNDHADVKELIPEFYQSTGSFLLNTMNLDLGVRSDGNRVNNTLLPPWAKDAADFTRQCREALECDYVSAHLHHWIDLIFGYKQRGEEALEANNLFHYLTYEGEFNTERVHDPKELAAIELQVKEFGQTPRQLFTRPHPSRLISRTPPPPLTPTPPPSHSSQPDEPVKTEADTTAGLGYVGGGSCNPEEEWVDVQMPKAGPRTLTLKLKNKLHKEPVSSVFLSHDGKTIYSASHDKTLKVCGVNDGGQLLRSSSISGLPLSCLSLLPDSKCVLVGSWDNNVYVYSVEYASVVCSAYCHDSSITSLVWKNNLLVTGSWDSTVKVWDFPYPPPNDQTRPEAPKIICELDHDNEVSCVDLHGSKVASGTVDGFVTLWSVDGFREFELQAHSEGVTVVLFNQEGNMLCTCGGDGVVRLLDTSSHTEVISKREQQVFHCAAWNGDLLILGGEGGGVHIWDAATLSEITSAQEHTGPITGVSVSSDGRLIATGGRDKDVALWDYT